jgi:hypothetical protein
MNLTELQTTLDNLPDLTTKLHNWKPLITKIEHLERTNLTNCLTNFNSTDLNLLKSNNLKAKEDYEYYEGLFNALLARLKIPVNIYESKILEIEKASFKSKVYQFRKDEEIRCTKKAKDLANQYFTDFKQKPRLDKAGYIRDVESLITGFLFQPEIYPCKDYDERQIFSQAFIGFDPQGYFKVFSVEFRELMKLV